MTQLASLSTQISAESASFLRGIEDCRGGLKRLISSLDPVAAATARYNANVTTLDNGLKQNKITQDVYASSVARLKKQLDDVVQSQGSVTASSGRVRAGMQQLGYNINDIATGFATGQHAMQIFAQQGGQVVQALQLIVGESKGFIGFLAGPWGLVLTAAATVAVPLITNIFGIGTAADETKVKVETLTDKIRKLMDAAGQVDFLKYGEVQAELLKKNAAIAQVDSQIKSLNPATSSQFSSIFAPNAPTRGRQISDLQAQRAQLVNERDNIAADLGAIQKQIAARTGLARLHDQDEADKKASSAAKSAAQKLLAEQKKVQEEYLRQQREFADSAAASLVEITNGRLSPIHASQVITDELVAQGNKAVDGLFDGKERLAAFQKEMQETAAKTKLSWADAAHSILNSFDTLARGIQGGDFLSILKGVLDIFLELGSLGLFGSKIQGNIKGARAGGGPVSGGSTYLVGERGPELFTPGTSGHIVANDNLGRVYAAAEPRMVRVVVDTSPLLVATMDERATAVAAPMSLRAAQGGAELAQRRSARNTRNRIPGRASG